MTFETKGQEIVKSALAVAGTMAITMMVTLAVIAISKWIGLIPDPPAAVCVCDGSTK